MVEPCGCNWKCKCFQSHSLLLLLPYIFTCPSVASIRSLDFLVSLHILQPPTSPHQTKSKLSKTRVAVMQTIYVLIGWTVSPPQKGFLLDFFPFFFGRVWMQLEMQMCSIPFSALPLLPLDLPNPRSQDSTPNTASGKQLVIFFSDQIQFGYIAKLVIFRATSISPYFKIANQLEIFALDLLFRATLIWLYFKIAFEAIFHKSAPAISKK